MGLSGLLLRADEWLTTALPAPRPLRPRGPMDAQVGRWRPKGARGANGAMGFQPRSVGRSTGRRAARGLSRSREQRARSARCEVCGQSRRPFRTLLSGLEPHGPPGSPASRGVPRARHRRHHRPISGADALPTPPAGRYHSVVPRFANSVRDPKFNSLYANFDLEDCR
jgi:hypothetical protein